MTWAFLKKTASKTWIWCRQHWRWLVFSVAIILSYLAGRKKNRALLVQANLAKKQYQKEAAAIEKSYKEAEQKKAAAEIKYRKSLALLEKKYDDDNSSLQREKDKEYKKQLKNAKNNPEKLDQVLQGLGINEVKK
tara:strand:- start:918 stop:1322 length:405 start_codon:yes stop_codon:yes gene_type:complete